MVARKTDKFISDSLDKTGEENQMVDRIFQKIQGAKAKADEAQSTTGDNPEECNCVVCIAQKLVKSGEEFGPIHIASTEGSPEEIDAKLNECLDKLGSWFGFANRSEYKTEDELLRAAINRITTLSVAATMDKAMGPKDHGDGGTVRYVDENYLCDVASEIFDLVGRSPVHAQIAISMFNLGLNVFTTHLSKKLGGHKPQES